MSVFYMCMQDHYFESKQLLFTHKVQNTMAGLDMRAYRLILEAPWPADVEQALNHYFEWTCFDQSVFVLSLLHISEYIY